VSNTNKEKTGGKNMPEYLVLLKLNPTKLMETLGAIRNMDAQPVSGVDLLYSMNIFGSWDVGMWINAEESGQALDFVQKKMKGLNGVTEVYTLPTFPHGNGIKNGKTSEEQKHPLET
jgi:hypothetical protein